MTSPALRAYRFGQFRVDLLRREITDSLGTGLPLAARAYDVLVFLVENRARVVSKDDLMRAVWPKSVVEENNLNQAITTLRRVLGDRREAPQFVCTIAGRGYRFVGEVIEEREGAGESPPRLADVSSPPRVAAENSEQAAVDATSERDVGSGLRRRLLIGLGLAGLTGGAAWLFARRTGESGTEPIQSLAVLPFRPLVEGTGDPAMELGMADTLITRLSTLPGLVVRPLSSVRGFGAPDQDAVEAGRALRTAAVLEGHLLVRENRVRLTARMLDVASGAAIWSGSFEEPLDQFLAAQDALAAQVVSALQIRMTDSDRRRVLDRPTDDVRAWRAYLDGRYHWERKTPEGFRRAIESFEAAEQLDPGFALATVGQANCWAVLGVYAAVPPVEAFTRAGLAAERAVRLAPEHPEAMAAMGHVLVQGRREWRGGERLYRRALDADPRLAQCRMWLANNAAYQGRLEEALREARHAQQLEPLSRTFDANVGLILYLSRDFDAALAHLLPLVAAAPEFPLSRHYLVRVYIAQGTPEKAIAMLDGLPKNSPFGMSIRGMFYAATGQTELALAEIAQLEARGAQGFGVGFDLALIHAALGVRDRALDAVERAVTDSSQQFGFLNLEPGLDLLRDEPRFRAVSRQVGLG